MKIKELFPLGFQWQVMDPFLFCVHHFDQYPQGNGQLGLDKKYLKGRNIGEDFQVIDGFRLYHGEQVPGFPVHPHRGFETITIVRQGYVDHADSLGAAGRYGMGDVQWMTAGRGVQHSEMFPLIYEDQANTVELFQIWINLPKKNKMVEPFFSMFWSERIPRVEIPAHQGVITIIAGQFDGVSALVPPPSSWASDPKNGVRILLIYLAPKGRLTLSEGSPGAQRMIHFFKGENLEISGHMVSQPQSLLGDANEVSLLMNQGDEPIEILVLEAVPISEPVFQYGPFVMNSKQEVIQAFEDYRRTNFGGWNWDRNDMVHGPRPQRFAKFPDGRIESPETGAADLDKIKK